MVSFDYWSKASSRKVFNRTKQASNPCEGEIVALCLGHDKAKKAVASLLPSPINHADQLAALPRYESDV
jgi:hypothetical protein